MSKYEQQMKTPDKQIATTMALVSKTTALSLRYPVRPTAAREAAAYLSSARNELRRATTGLRAISPPRAARGSHATLLQGTIELRAELVPIIARLKKGYLIATARLPHLVGLAKIASARTAFEKQGYSF